MEQLIKKILKTFFIFSMLLVNIIFVSKPCIEKYFEGGIVIEATVVSLNDIPSPAFTISRLGPDGMLVFSLPMPTSVTFF